MAGQWRGDLSKRPDEPEAAAGILRYFIEHPEAADTLEGLAHWRLIERGAHWTIEHFAEALAWLVARGYLKQMSKPYADRIYSLSEENLEQAEKYLAKKGGPKD